jgi:hypothetical protein
MGDIISSFHVNIELLGDNDPAHIFHTARPDRKIVTTTIVLKDGPTLFGVKASNSMDISAEESLENAERNLARYLRRKQHQLDSKTAAVHGFQISDIMIDEEQIYDDKFESWDKKFMYSQVPLAAGAEYRSHRGERRNMEK